MRSGYGPSVSDGVTAQPDVDVPPVDEPPVLPGLVGDDEHAATAAALTLAPSAASNSRRAIFFVAFEDIARVRASDVPR